MIDGSGGGRHDLSKRLASFGLLPVLASGVSFVALPILARAATHEQWAALGIGQSIGFLCAAVTALGWPLTGPVRVAGLDDESSWAIYRESLVTRVFGFAFCAPIGIALAAILCAHGSRWLGILMVLSVAVSGLSPAWFIVGAGTPGQLAFHDVVPRLVSALASSVVIAAVGSESLWLYPFSILVASLAGYISFVLRRRRHERDIHAWRQTALRSIKRQLPVGLAVITATTYTSFSVALFAISASSSETASYSSATKLFFLACQAILVVSQTTQPWAIHNVGATRPQLLMSLKLYAGVGCLGLIGFAAAGPLVVRIAFGEQFGISRTTATAFGLAFLSLALGSFVSNQLLLPHGHQRSVLTATVLAALAGVPATIILAAVCGPEGGAAGFALGEFTSASIVGASAWRHRRNRAAIRNESKVQL